MRKKEGKEERGRGREGRTERRGKEERKGGERRMKGRNEKNVKRKRV